MFKAIFPKWYWYLKAPKQTGPRPRPYFDISAPHVRTQPWQRRSWKQAKMTHKHIQTKANTDRLCETIQNQRQETTWRPLRALPALWVRFACFEQHSSLETFIIICYCLQRDVSVSRNPPEIILMCSRNISHYYRFCVNNDTTQTFV